MQDFRELARALLPETIEEERFDFWAADVEQYILSYCGTAAIPEGADTLAAQMLASAYSEEESGRVVSVSRGDTSVSFSENDMERFHSFDMRLNAFRKLKWQ